MTEHLFTHKDWAIAKFLDPKTIPGLDCFAAHISCEKPKMYSDNTKNEVSWLVHEPPHCWACNESVPDEIQALLRLHEWDTEEPHL